MHKLKVGIIGCGTIGGALGKWIKAKFKKMAVVAYLCDHHEEKAYSLKKKLGRTIRVVSLRELIRKADLIIEAASASVSREVVEFGLKHHKMLLIMSVGGLLDSDRWFKLACESRGRVWIPSGAIAGVDGISAARNTKIRRVKLITKKPPLGLMGAPYFQKKCFPRLHGKREVCVFRGSALDAVKAFPQNVNVAAILSLAGIGPRRTEVEIWTSLRYRVNEHEIYVEGDSGKIRTVTSNAPSPENAKTSYLAILSAVAVLKKIFSSIEIGT
ncbi:MAG: DUF108 domain-containing protein [Candidatus Omnitrophica bacterium]|nr:DUF108 domain-containing protein [Candidatus Omnitrophota bacterium]